MNRESTAIWAGLIWNIAVWGTATFLIFGPPDHSGWWFLLAAALSDDCSPPKQEK